jgi:ABC-2 type transport system permease protein
MNRTLAIIEREMRKFFRSPALMMVSMIFPLVQLIVLGNAFGGKIRDAKMGIVDEDHGTQAIKIKEAFDSVRATSRTFLPVYYDDEVRAREDVRDGKIQGAVIIPAQYSAHVYEKNHPQIALIVDNSDNFMSSTLTQKMTELTEALNQPDVEPRLLQQTALQVVELYPYIEYMKYLLPGSIALAMFVTPITKAELVIGLNGAGAIKGVLTGVTITLIGSLLAGVGTLFSVPTMVGLIAMIIVTAAAFNCMMFLMMVRVEDPLVPRATFGILNTLLFFPSGSIYPVQAFPRWLRAITYVDPFTYSVHGFKALLLKESGLGAIVPDLLFLGLFAAITIGLAVPLFKRTL